MDDQREAFQAAIRETWQMVNPFKPAGDPGSYARGEHNGIVAALQTIEENFNRHFARQAIAAPGVAQGWQPISTAPKDRTEILACWPKRKLDDDECPTGEITGYAQCVTAWQGFWIEPDYLEAHGSFYFEDEAFAAEPTHWMPLPAAPSPTEEQPIKGGTAE